MPRCAKQTGLPVFMSTGHQKPKILFPSPLNWCTYFT